MSSVWMLVLLEVVWVLLVIVRDYRCSVVDSVLGRGVGVLLVE